MAILWPYFALIKNVKKSIIFYVHIKIVIHVIIVIDHANSLKLMLFWKRFKGKYNQQR